MRKYKKETQEVLVVETITCDCCKQEFDTKKDFLEIQEMHHISFVGGFGSVFGDNNEVKCDLCQKCLDKLVGKYLRINSESDSEEV